MEFDEDKVCDIFVIIKAVIEMYKNKNNSIELFSLLFNFNRIFLVDKS